jgi:hypothetical protein
MNIIYNNKYKYIIIVIEYLMKKHLSNERSRLFMEGHSCVDI